jgi:acetolactate synthase-1/2/3 large subunit
VLIDIPADISSAVTEWKPAFVCAWENGDVLGSRAKRLSRRSERTTFTGKDIARAAQMLLEAKRPMLYAGGGVISSGACEELTFLADALNAPVALSLMGIGAVPRDYPLCTGMIGMHGTAASNRAVQRADLLAAIGARFSDRVTSRPDHFARNAKILHIDIDPAEINKNRIADFWVVGNIKEILKEILKKIPPVEKNGWKGEIEKLKKQDRISRERAVKASSARQGQKGEFLHPRFVVETAAKGMSFNTLVVTDVGQHQIWAAQYYPAALPRSFLSSGGLGAMGFGLGAALGAKLAHPDKPVLLFTGDGSFRMNNGELATLVRYRIPLLIILFNNGVLGMVRQWQHVFCENTYSESALAPSPDFIALVSAYGIPSYRAASEGEFRSALDSALEDNRRGSSAFIEAVIDKDEMVLPMVPGGKAVDEQIF